MGDPQKWLVYHGTPNLKWMIWGKTKFEETTIIKGIIIHFQVHFYRWYEPL